MRIEYKTSAYWIFAFMVAAAVTFILPGTGSDEAFVDVMGIFISVACFGLGLAHIIRGIVLDWTK